LAGNEVKKRRAELPNGKGGWRRYGGFDGRRGKKKLFLIVQLGLNPCCMRKHRSNRRGEGRGHHRRKRGEGKRERNRNGGGAFKKCH